MAIAIVWTEGFRDELRREFEFIRQSNAQAANLVLDRIIHSSRRLADFPRSGRSWRLKGTWELVVSGTPYIVVYSIEPNSVLILRLFHTSREAPVQFR